MTAIFASPTRDILDLQAAQTSEPSLFADNRCLTRLKNPSGLEQLGHLFNNISRASR